MKARDVYWLLEAQRQVHLLVFQPSALRRKLDELLATKRGYHQLMSWLSELEQHVALYRSVELVEKEIEDRPGGADRG